MYRLCVSAVLLFGGHLWPVESMESACDAKDPGCEATASQQIASRGGGGPREITVMSFNTFFIKLPQAPQIPRRSDYLSSMWRNFNTSHVPDVLVLNEMWHGYFLAQLCNEAILYDNMLWGRGTSTVTDCTPGFSPFGAVTPVANDYTFPLAISSGVVMLVKKGVTLEWRPEWDYEFQASGGFDFFAHKGAQLIKVTLPDDKGVYYVVGTHMQSDHAYEDTRTAQFKELVAFIENKVPAGHTVILAGDLNVEEKEIPSMMQILTRGATSHEPPGFTSTGFWATNSPELKCTECNTNHFQDENVLPKRYDWIIPLALDTTGRLTMSRKIKMQYQYVPVRTSRCYAAHTKYKKRYMSDLADHYAVIAHLRDEHSGALPWAKGLLKLPSGDTCPQDIPSDNEVDEETVSTLAVIFVWNLFWVIYFSCFLPCCCCCCIIYHRKKIPVVRPDDPDTNQAPDSPTTRETITSAEDMTTSSNSAEMIGMRSRSCKTKSKNPFGRTVNVV